MLLNRLLANKCYDLNKNHASIIRSLILLRANIQFQPIELLIYSIFH